MNGATGDFVGWMTHNNAGKCGFPCAVSTHDGMDFTAIDLETDALNNWRIAN